MINNIELIRTLQGAGLMVDTIEAGRLIRCKTTEDRGQEKSGWYRVFDDIDLVTAVYGCWRNDSRGVWVSNANRQQVSEQRAYVRRLIEQSKQERQKEQVCQWVRNGAKLLTLWDSAAPITEHDPAGQYLSNRGLTVPNTHVLRYHAELEYWHDGRLIGLFPAMLAAVGSPTGELITIHRTFLTDDGYKAPVPTVKKLMPSAGVMAGASIKMGAPMPRSDGRLGIGIAEGIETALAAAMLFGIPVWAGVSAHGLASFAPPLSARNVYVFSDNDKSQTGQKAAARLADRLTPQGYAVRIHTPPTIGDWHDVLINNKKEVAA